MSVFALMRDVIFGRDFGLRQRRREPEITKEYLEALQSDIDSRLEEGLTFKTVKRASW